MTDINITYSYTPTTWSQEEFLRLGGFTIVFLNYNKGELVQEAARSALGQDFPLCEVVMLDDNSTDGSGETMERVAREYRGPYKVTVVRNAENQTIAGQWNIAARLTSGNWLGMFCGDDVAFPNRVSEIAALVKEYPTAWGICTNAVVAGGGTFCKNRRRGVWSGEDGDQPPENMYGGMTFWRRGIFDTELPRCNMDDYLLQYMVMIRRAKCREASLVWALDRNTVNYSLGGITNAEAVAAGRTRSRLVRIWKQGRAKLNFGRKYGIHVWRHVEAYAAKFLTPGNLDGQIRGLSLMYRCQSGGWWERLKVLLILHLFSRGDSFGGVRNRITREIDRRFLAFFFGLPGYVLYTLMTEWRLRRKNKKSKTTTV